MTILEALQAVNSYPISNTHIEVICLDRGLASTDEYTQVIGASQVYRLATADTYFYLANHPDLTEQEVSIKQAAEIKKQLLSLANKIYFEFDDPKYTGFTYGFIGEGYN